MDDPTARPAAAGAASAARRPIGTYSSYAEAQRAVDFLSDRRFPVERVTIVGRDLEFVEQVTGRLTVARAALQGAVQGSLLGLFFALLIGLFFTVTGALVALLLYGFVVGAIFGAVLGAVAQAATGGRRDFSAVGAMRANHYDVLADHDVAEEALRLLGELPPSTDTPPTSPGREAGAPAH